MATGYIAVDLSADYNDEPIEAGSGSEYDNCSTVASDVTSLASEVFQYQYENGRRYHNFRAGKYHLPNDEVEQERLDMAHHVWNLLLRGHLHKAPLAESGPIPKRAIDLGCGTGIWTIEFGDLYPDCTIIGTDLSPIQPNWVPENVHFQVDDFEDMWTFPKDHFGYVHIRNLIGAVKDFPGLVKNAYDHLAPGGFIEIQESDINVESDDGTVNEKTCFHKYISSLQKAGEIIGQRMDIIGELSQYLEEAGFVNIVEKQYKVPFGSWPKHTKHKEIGQWMQEVLKTGAEAYGLALFTRVLGMSDTEARKLCDQFNEEVADNSIHSYGKWRVLYAQKPKA